MEWRRFVTYLSNDPRISRRQKEKLKKALAQGRELTIRLSCGDLVGEDVIAVTQSHLNKLNEKLS